MAPIGVITLGCKNMYHLKPETESPRNTKKTAKIAGKGFIEDRSFKTFEISTFESTQYSAKMVIMNLRDISINLRNFAKSLHEILKTQDGI